MPGCVGRLDSACCIDVSALKVGFTKRASEVCDKHTVGNVENSNFIDISPSGCAQQRQTLSLPYFDSKTSGPSTCAQVILKPEGDSSKSFTQGEKRWDH